MAAITPVKSRLRGAAEKTYERFSGTGTANQTDTLTATAGGDNQARRVRYVTVSYSAAPTQTGVIITLDSGLGPAFDTVLYTGSANVQDTFWTPDEEFPLHPDDAIVVTAPAAGGVIKASIVIVMEAG